MPVSKKPRTKAASERRPGSRLFRRCRTRRAMESYLATIAGRSRNDAITKAQDVMYDAWERTTSRSRVALARKALGISPLCADAYNLLAEEAGSVEEARDLYAKAVDAGELALGPKGFKEYAGHFWGIPRNPPLHARQGRSRRHSPEARR